jgi:hypothetical protein
MQRTALIFALLIGISGCATEPVPTNAASPIPPARVLAAGMTKPKDGSASLILKRDTGLNNGACTFRLSIDGQPFADIDAGEKIEIHTLPGEHILGARSNGICFAGNAETVTAVKTGQTRTFRVSVGSGGELKIQPTAF